MYYTFDKSAVKQIKPIIQQMHQTKPLYEEDYEENLCCWSQGESLAGTFCQDSSLHGLKYIGQPKRHHFERIFWLVAFLISGVGCFVTIAEFWEKYWHSPVVTVFQPVETPVDLIPFPAVTICNVNNVRKSRANQYIERAKNSNMTFNERLKAFADLYDLNHICEASTTFAQRFNVSDRSVVEPSLLEQVLRLRRQLPGSDPTQVLRKATQNCSELILLCLWLDQEQDCNTFFQGIETDYGFCCTFNLVPLTLLLKYRNDSRDDPQVVKEWNAINEATDHNVLFPAIENDKNIPPPKYPFRQVYHGRSSGLSVLLDPDLDEYFCTNTDSDGFVIGTSHPLDFPRVRDHGIAVRPNSETFMSIRPDMTVADSSIFKFSIEKRKCYLSEEFQLQYYSYYTPSNCVDECIANHTFSLCHCVQYYMPRSTEQSLCSPEQFECTERVRKEVVQRGLLKECNRCLPICNDLDYQVETTFLNMRSNVFIKENFRALGKSLNGKNMTIVHLYMGVDSTYPRLRKEIYTLIDMISSTGGLLSLCLGFSILSVLEILYFSTIRVCRRSYAKKKNKSSPASAFIAKTSRLFPEAWNNPVNNNYPTVQQQMHVTTTTPGPATMFGFIPKTGERFQIIN